MFMVVKPIIYLFYECVSIYNEIAWWSNSYQIHITSFFNEILSFFPISIQSSPSALCQLYWYGTPKPKYKQKHKLYLFLKCHDIIIMGSNFEAKRTIFSQIIHYIYHFYPFCKNLPNPLFEFRHRNLSLVPPPQKKKKKSRKSTPYHLLK